MRRFPAFPVLMLLALALLCAAPARADDDSALRTTLVGRYAAMKVATQSRDPKKMDEILAPGFTSVSIAGKVKTREQMLHDLGALPPKDMSTFANTTVKSVKDAGGAAVVDQVYQMDTVRSGKDGAQNPIRAITDSTDTWVKAGNTWLLKKTVTNSADIYINSILVAHRVRGKRWKETEEAKKGPAASCSKGAESGGDKYGACKAP